VRADRKSRPKVLLNTVVAGAAAFVLSLVFVFLREAFAKRKQQSAAHPLAA
jgi:uncharacterized protein involved in exopolysaccharide biosynthesis